MNDIWSQPEKVNEEEFPEAEVEQSLGQLVSQTLKNISRNESFVIAGDEEFV